MPIYHRLGDIPRKRHTVFRNPDGGIYYEHVHRLLGSLVGLVTLVLAVHLWRTEPRRWLRRLGFGALALVIVQGILGVLRVTGGFTLTTSPEEVSMLKTSPARSPTAYRDRRRCSRSG